MAGWNDGFTCGSLDREEYKCFRNSMGLGELCAGPSVRSPPPALGLGWALKDNGFRLRSSQFLRFGTRLRRAPAGGGVATHLDAPRVTVLSPPPLPPPPHRRRAAPASRTELPQFARGGLCLLPGQAPGTVQGPGRQFSFSGVFPTSVSRSLCVKQLVWKEQRAAGIDGRKKRSFLANSGGEREWG